MGDEGVWKRRDRRDIMHGKTGEVKRDMTADSVRHDKRGEGYGEIRSNQTSLRRNESVM